jgi:competence protein ComEC
MKHALIILVSGAVMGVFVSTVFGFSWYVFLFGMFLASLAGGSFYSARDRRYLLLSIALIFLSLGYLRAHVVPQVLNEEHVREVGEEVVIEGVVVDTPDVRDTHQRVVVKDSGGEKTLAVLPRYPELSYGEWVKVSGTRTLPETFETESGRVFRYDHYLNARGIGSLLSFASVEEVKPREGWYHLRGVLFDVRKKLEEGVALAIPEPEASLALGMLLGGKQGLGEVLLDAFTVVGLLHIVVLSGYNVMVVAESVLRVLNRFGKRRALLISGVVLVLFVVMAGGGSAALRALLMALIALLARYTGKTYGALRALAVVVFLMVLVNPLLLVYDPGFGLSVMATLGLILGVPHIEKRLLFVKWKMLREVLSTTLGAQLFVLPLLLYETGNLSLIALPVSVLVLPVIPLAMMLSFFSAVVGVALPPLALFSGFPAYVLLSYITSVATYGSMIPFANVMLGTFPFWIVLLSYFVLFLCIYTQSRASARTRA